MSDHCMPSGPAPHADGRPGRAVYGFTLIELLVVMGVISVLMGILLPAMAEAKKAAKTARDLSGGRQLMVAYHLYADDNRGSVLPGYLNAANASTVLNNHGEPVHDAVVGWRYPWRIAPYLEYNFEGLYQDAGVLRETRQYSNYEYRVSLWPSFGINGVFVGGDADNYGFNQAALKAWGGFYVTRLDQVVRGERLGVFFTARGRDPDTGVVQPGYFRVLPPYIGKPKVWTVSSFNAADDPAKTGYTDFRHGGKVIVGTIDGHAETLGYDDARDMTRWSNQATDSTWNVQRDQ